MKAHGRAAQHATIGRPQTLSRTLDGPKERCSPAGSGRLPSALFCWRPRVWRFRRRPKWWASSRRQSRTSGRTKQTNSSSNSSKPSRTQQSRALTLSSRLSSEWSKQVSSETAFGPFWAILSQHHKSLCVAILLDIFACYSFLFLLSRSTPKTQP